jgi:hypothetical protein
MVYYLASFSDSDGPLLIALAMAALVVILATSSTKKRPAPMAQKPQTCRGCGTVHPGYANFCRRCGRRLD